MNKKKSFKSGSKETEKPFSDYGFTRASGFIDPKIGDIPLEKRIKYIQSYPGNESEKLRVLTCIYKEYMKEAQQVALSHFWKAAQEFVKSDIPYLTKKEWEILCKAEAGVIDAIQKLVAANPEAVYLPFVAEAVVGILRKYRNTVIPKGGSNIATLEDIKLQWIDFLPSRAGAKHPYSAWILGDLVNRARKKAKAYGKPAEKEFAYLDVAKALNMGIETIKKQARFKKARGRPSKK